MILKVWFVRDYDVIPVVKKFEILWYMSAAFLT